MPSDLSSEERRARIRSFFEFAEMDVAELEDWTDHAFDFFIVLSALLDQRDPDRYERWRLRRQIEAAIDENPPQPRKRFFS